MNSEVTEDDVNRWCQSMHLIDDFLYLGDYRAAKNATSDKFKAIITVLDTNFPLWEDIRGKTGIEYLNIMVEDHEDTDLLTYFPQTNEYIAGCVESERPILVHCAAGISRSATIVCAYVMKKYRLSAEEAIDEVRRKREIIYPNIGFVRQLELFHRMGYTLDANNKQFRYYLIEKYCRVEEMNELIAKYFERLSIAQTMTKVIELGRSYCCSYCCRIAFNEISIIRNDDSKDRSQCQDMYIEPQEWMSDRIQETCVYYPYGIMREINLIRKNILPESSKGLIKCPNCHKGLVSFHRFLTPYPLEWFSGGCAVHQGLDKFIKFKVIADAVKVYDPSRDDTKMAQMVSTQLNLGPDGTPGTDTHS